MLKKPVSIQTASLTDLQQHLVARFSEQEAPKAHDIPSLLQDEPLIRFVNRMILDAAIQHASDIHIEPFEDNCRIRTRMHGVLQVTCELPPTLANRLTARLKIMAALDIAERRLPQDGRFHFQGIDIRINTCPVLFGEKTVLRLLKTNNTHPDLTHIGMNDEEKQLYCHALKQPQGMILVTGPTGSGKTVTLYAGLNHLNQPSKNIVTVEDPVEIRFKGINQVNTNPRSGLHFASILRALLRQDPDIIMVGEIRDSETAQMAVHAAMTGHLVLTTLHTNNAHEALLRLSSIGIRPEQVDSSIRLIIAQRLIRVLCLNCRRSVYPDKKIFPEINHTSCNTVYESAGCDQCFNGYTGRTGIFEFLTFSQPISPTSNKSSLRKTGIAAVLAGITSPSELARVLES